MKLTVPAAIVTGASRGLGRGIALELAGSGFSVVIDYASNEEAARATAEECRKQARSGSQAFPAVQADVGRADERRRLVDTCLEQFGRIDVLVNNAGVAPTVRIDITEMSEESFDRVLAVNLKGQFFLTQLVANHWLEKNYQSLLPGGFKIIFIGSISADTASLNRGEYCMSKAALAMAAQLWAVRLASQGVQVFELRPGIMETDMTDKVREKYDKLIAEGLVPQGRWGSPEDAGRAVKSLAAGDFSFSTGAVIYLDGGFNLKRL